MDTIRRLYKRLTCPHEVEENGIKYSRFTPYYITNKNIYEKHCLDCGKVER